MITFILLFACLQVYGASASLEDKGSSPYAETKTAKLFWSPAKKLARAEAAKLFWSQNQKLMDTMDTEEAKLWWSQNQKLINDERSALTACVHAEIGDLKYGYFDTPEEVQQFVKPIIDILQQIHKEGLDSAGWPDLQTMTSYYTAYSDAFDQIKTTLDLESQMYNDIDSLFWYFLECVHACCKKDQCRAVDTYIKFMRLAFNIPKECEKQSQVTRIYSLHASRAERESIVANCVPDTQKCTHTIKAYFSPSELMKNHERILQNGEED